jgi:hypothetical protein
VTPSGPSGPPAPANGGTVAPADNGNYIEFDENGTPLGEWRWDEDAGQWIYDEYPPLASLPQTGQLNWPVPALFLLGALLLLLGLRLNRREDARSARRARSSPIGEL